MQTPNRISIVVIGKKYLSELVDIMTVVERLHEDTAALPFAIFVDSVDDIETSDNISSHVTPSLVRILIRNVTDISIEHSSPTQDQLILPIILRHIIKKNLPKQDHIIHLCSR